MKATVTESPILRWSNSVGLTFLCGYMLLAWTVSAATPPVPGNLLVTVNEFTGSSTAPTYIAEYTVTGSRVQRLAHIPAPGGTGPTTEQARDLVLGPDGAVYLYNGTFTPYLARLNVAGSNWTQQTFTGWSTAAITTYGGISRFREYIFAADMATGGGGAPQGIVRFDCNGGPTVRFVLSIQPNDIYIGPDQVLYALDGSGSTGNTVYKFDARTFVSLGTVRVASAGHRGVAVATDGSIFLADSSGVIRRYAAGGGLLDSLTVPGESFSDIDIDGAGRIALGTGSSGDVVLTDLSLDNFTRFLPTDNQRSGDTFVSWVPVQAQSPSLNISLVGTNVAVQISGTLGASYTIEHTAFSTTNSWQVATNLTLISSPVTILHAPTAGPARFYRAASWP